MSMIAASPKKIFTLLKYFLVFTSCLTSYAAWARAEGVEVKRLYVEPFTTRSGADKLRDDVTSELRKANIVQLASTEASANAILDGGGEIWVKGYRSLNPRSGRLPSDGTPIYDGYLAVELKNSKGQTFWSDLVTPATNSPDVSRDLAKRIAKDVALALKRGEPAALSVPLSPPSTVLKGAGATFPQPVYDKWFTNYRVLNPNLEIDYSAIGSKAGVQRLLAADVDFGASDCPVVIHDLAPDKESSYLLLPSVVGAVVPIVNLPGLSGNIALTSEALAGIYLGKIKRWNDPVLRAANRGLHLPDLEITVVHRSDGSGTSYALTDYLSKTSPVWKADVGASLQPKWPVGKGANGNEGVAQMVKEYGGSIGYVEFIYALKNHISSAKVRNQYGEFVAASLESMTVAVNQSAPAKSNFAVSIVDAPGAGAYPIASFTWLVVPTTISGASKREAIKGFLHWMLGPGQTQAAALGFLALPRDVVVKEEARIAELH